MTTPAFEAFLARVYTDEALRRRFLADPEATARAAGLSEAEAQALAKIDRVGVQMAARTFNWKRAKLRKRGRIRQFADILWRRLKRFKSHEYTSQTPRRP